MAIPYYRWFPGDYSRDTRHLSLMQHGAYRLLIDLYMDAGPLRNDLQYLYRWLHAESIEEKSAVEFILGEFFLLQADRWFHKRCDSELKWQKQKSEEASSAAVKRWESVRTADAMRTHSGRNANQNQNQNQSKPKTYAPPELVGFQKFWATWPANSRKGGKAKCEAVWLKQKYESVAEGIIAHVSIMKQSADWRGGYCPAPLVYLNQARWDGASTAPAERKLAI